jgi:PPE-repeat protein
LSLIGLGLFAGQKEMNAVRTFDANIVVVFVGADDLASAVNYTAVMQAFAVFGGLQNLDPFGPALAANERGGAPGFGRNAELAHAAANLLVNDKFALLRDLNREAFAIAQIGTAQIGTAQIGTAQIGTAQIGTAQIGTAQIGTAQIGTAQIGTAQIGTAQIGTAQIGTAQIGTAQIGTAQIGIAQIGTAQIGTSRNRSNHHGGKRFAGPPAKNRTIPALFDFKLSHLSLP